MTSLLCPDLFGETIVFVEVPAFAHSIAKRKDTGFFNDRMRRVLLDEIVEIAARSEKMS